MAEDCRSRSWTLLDLLDSKHSAFYIRELNHPTECEQIAALKSDLNEKLSTFAGPQSLKRIMVCEERDYDRAVASMLVTQNAKHHRNVLKNALPWWDRVYYAFTQLNAVFDDGK